MASVIWILSVVLYAEFMCAVSANRLLSLDCQDENHGVHGKDSLLKCFLDSGGESVKVTWATWRRPGEKRPLIMFINDKVRMPEDPRFSFKQLQMSGSNIDVSFLVRNTVRTDEGKYECEVGTDSGEAKAVVSLSVTATYSKPDMSSVPEKDLQEGMEVTDTTAPEKVTDKGSTAIAVVSVVIGSLLCVLLILALLHRRRIQREYGNGVQQESARAASAKQQRKGFSSPSFFLTLPVWLRGLGNFVNCSDWNAAKCSAVNWLHKCTRPPPLIQSWCEMEMSLKCPLPSKEGAW